MDRIKKGSGKGFNNIPFHYTSEKMVRDLIHLIPFKGTDSVLDVGSGKNKVWYNNLPNGVIKYECEIEDGCDFLKWEKEVDWVIGNPPYKIGWKFFEKAIEISRKGIAFLLSIRGFNMLTPKRFEKLKNAGFYLNKIHIVSDKRWYGRYYFVVFTKSESDMVSWDIRSY